MQERANATPTSLRKNKITSSLRLATLDRISRGLSVARNVASGSIKTPVQAALSDPTASKLKSKTGEDSRGKISRGKVRFVQFFYEFSRYLCFLSKRLVRKRIQQQRLKQKRLNVSVKSIQKEKL